MFGIVGWIVFGVIVGVLAKLVMPGRDPGGFIITMLLGIVGAVVGGFVGRALGLYRPEEPAGLLMSIVGAVVVLGGRRTRAALLVLFVALALATQPIILYGDPRYRVPAEPFFAMLAAAGLFATLSLLLTHITERSDARARH